MEPQGTNPVQVVMVMVFLMGTDILIGMAIPTSMGTPLVGDWALDFTAVGAGGATVGVAVMVGIEADGATVMVGDVAELEDGVALEAVVAVEDTAAAAAIASA